MEGGLFEPLVMFFGMTNSPAIFQTMMNDIFRTLIAEGIVVVYLDNILIFTRMEEEHERAVQRVLEVLAEHKLFLCPEKCEFHRKERSNTSDWSSRKTRLRWTQLKSLESAIGPPRRTGLTYRPS